MRTLITLLLFLAISAPLLAQSGAYALTNGRIETVTNGVIERGTLLIREGRIERIGENLAIPSDAEVIDCSGLTIYPGMIDASSLGSCSRNVVPIPFSLSTVTVPPCPSITRLIITVPIPEPPSFSV